MYMKLYGERDGRVGTVMCSLAQVKCAKGEYVLSTLLYILLSQKDAFSS